MQSLHPVNGHAGPGWQVEPSAAAGLRVLVVEDDADTAAALAQLLELEGCRVRVTADGPAALQAAESDQPAVVLLDLGLPGMNGYDVARGLRAQRVDRRPLLIAVTGRGELEDRVRSYESGIDLHLTKPVDIGELRHFLGRFQTVTAPPAMES